MSKFILIVCCVALVGGRAWGQESEARIDHLMADQLRPSLYSETMVMVHDVVNPPAASRYYTYILLGAYDLVSQRDSRIVGPGAVFPKYTPAVLTTPPSSYDYRIAAEYSILEAGRAFMPSGYMMKTQEHQFVELLRKHHIPSRVIDSSIAVAKALVVHVQAFAKGDNYNHLSAMLRYTPLRGEQFWYPTPPGYFEAIEPNWRIIRPMVVDTCAACKPPPPTPFSKDTASAFYHLVKAVYDTVNLATPEQTAIANFWDCNPFNMQTSGHMMIGIKKMSPAGHWIDITGNVTHKAGLDFDEAVLVHELVSAAMMDAFINCWDEKYRSNRIRPETYINRYMDPNWRPILQTPPFPEYTSGHSVISSAAAEMLTYLMGEKFTFTDNAEILFGVQPRSFTSFRQASKEAAISRFYGGIHYTDAVWNGYVQGKALGDKVVDAAKAAGIMPVWPKDVADRGRTR